MRHKKKILCNIIHAAKLDGLNLTNKDILYVLAYHRIRPCRDHVCCFDEAVWGPDLDQFRAHVHWVKNHSTLLSKDDLLDLMEHKRYNGGPYSMITFDDGYVDNYQYAFPILQDLKAYATFFIPSGQIEDRQIGWWDLIAYYIKNCCQESITVQNRVYQLDNQDMRVSTIHALQQRMKLEPARDTSGLIQELAQASKVPEVTPEQESHELMTWEQIKEMASSGMTIGSHGHTHTVMATMDIDTQIEEMKISRQIISGKIGQQVDSIAFPVGGESHFTAQTCQAAKELGYKLIYSYNTGFNKLARLNSGHIKRFEPRNELPLLSSAMAFPQLLI